MSNMVVDESTAMTRSRDGASRVTKALLPFPYQALCEHFQALFQ